MKTDNAKKRGTRSTGIAARARSIGIHRETLRKWIANGEGPVCHRFGRTVIITEDAWRKWLDSRQDGEYVS